MNIRHAILLILPVMLLTVIINTQSQPADKQPAASTPPSIQPAAYQTQMIWFARSGTPMTVELAPTMPRMDRAALLAFGRTWTEAVNTRKQGIKFVVDFKVPSVRVPTVFTIAHPDWPKRIMGELVAYPDRDIKWNKKTTLYSSGAPGWFDQWASATGLPVTYILPGRLDGWRKPKDKDKKQVLIIGRRVAGKKFADTLAIAKKHKINVLVLEAIWFGGKSGKVTVQPKQMTGGLAELRKQKWSSPPEFRWHRKPWPGISNRWAWISDKEGLPLVEKLAVASMPLMAVRPIILNYLPWEEQLGRSEQADELLRATLAAAADATLSGVGWRSLSFVHPKREKLDEKDRPVLTAAALGPIAFKDRPWSVHVLDVRGTDRLPEGLLEELKALERRVGADTESVLILGDDLILDDWKWAKIDRKKKKFKRRGIAWLPDDTLPPSAENQIRLMLKLTEFGILLKHPKPLKGEKKDEKPNK